MTAAFHQPVKPPSPVPKKRTARQTKDLELAARAIAQAVALRKDRRGELVKCLNVLEDETASKDKVSDAFCDLAIAHDAYEVLRTIAFDLVKQADPREIDKLSALHKNLNADEAAPQ